METALLKSKSKTNLMLLLDLARKIGVESTMLTFEEVEDIGLASAIKKGRTGKFVDPKRFVNSLRKRAK
jgi:hypothetical protein